MIYPDSLRLQKHYIPHLKALISALHVGEINCGSKVRGFSENLAQFPDFWGWGRGREFWGI